MDVRYAMICISKSSHGDEECRMIFKIITKDAIPDEKECKGRKHYASRANLCSQQSQGGNIALDILF